MIREFVTNEHQRKPTASGNASVRNGATCRGFDCPQTRLEYTLN